MSPVSSSTPTCASARWRNARGSMSNSGSGGFGGAHALASAAAALGVGVGVVALTGHGLDVDEARPRLHDAREQREVLAQRVPLELRREVEVAQRGMAVEHEAVHLPALALVPVGAGVHRHPRLHEQRLLVDVGLEREAPVAAGRLHAREHLEATVGAGGAVVVSVGCTGADVSLPASSPPSFGAGIQSMPGDEREVVAVERALGDLGGAAPVDAADAHDRHAEHRRLVEDRLAELAARSRATQLGVRWRRARADRARPPRSAPPRRAASGVLGAAHVTQRRSAPRANAARARGCRCPRSGSAPAAARCPG